MTPEPLTCPYCNARVPPPGPGEARGRTVCPRCGETFPYRPAATAVAAGVPPPSLAAAEGAANGTAPAPQLLKAAPSPAAVQLALVSGLVVAVSLGFRLALPESATTRTAFPFMFLLGVVGTVAAVWLWYFRARRSNGATALFFVGNMSLLALIVLLYALLTTDFRRSHDLPAKMDPNRTGPGKDGKPGEGRTPGELAALGYLPADSNLLIGVHVAELWHDKAGKAFLEQPSWGPLEAVLRQVKEWTGLRKDAIEHVAFGAQTKTLPFVRLTMVVRTKRPYNPKDFRVVLGKSKPMKHEGRVLYPLQIPVGPLRAHGALWCVSDRTLVLTVTDPFSTFEALKQSLPLQPRQGSAGLRPALRDCLEKRLPRDAWVWIAGESVPAVMLAAVLPLGRAGVPAPLQKVRVFSAGLRFAPGAEVMLSGDLQCADEKAAQALQSLLEGRKVPGLEVGGPASGPRDQALRGATVVGLGASVRGAEAAAVVGRLAATRPAEQGAEVRRWLYFQVQASPGQLRKAPPGGQGLFPRLGRRGGPGEEP